MVGGAFLPRVASASFLKCKCASTGGAYSVDTHARTLSLPFVCVLALFKRRNEIWPTLFALLLRLLGAPDWRPHVLNS